MTGRAAGDAPLTPRPYRVVSRHRECDGVVTLSLEPAEPPPATATTTATPHGFRPGQFNMLTAFGVGEAAISISSAPDDPGPLEHTVRAAGPVSHALANAPVGSVLGVRGPFGTGWDLGHLDTLDGPGDGPAHVLVMAGGIGLAPLRGTIRTLLARGSRGPDPAVRVSVLVGARTPDNVIYAGELEQWALQGARVEVTVDRPTPDWTGSVGVVTSLLGAVPLDPARTLALVCGPEVMMRFAARALLDRGVPGPRIRVSLERNMQCGVGWCGHCQLGPLLLCRDGPVVPYTGSLARLLTERER